jgi:peptidoglycan/xylan/chitin deacetylase (PgdA/CDA1 family)
VDLSSNALERARARSEAARVDGIEYLRLDVQADPLPGAFDLIVASEVLYYLADRDALAGVLAKLAAALRPGGRLVCTHPNLLVDDPDRTGFDWDVPYGSRVIGEALTAVPGLEAEVELRTPLYRVQAARRPRRIELPRRARATPRVIEAEAVGPDPDVAARLRVGGGEVAPSSDAVARTSPTVPILMYHHVAASGPEALARWRTDPEALEEQLDYLHGAGYVTLDLETWGAHLAARTPAPERAVVLTFDDAYADLPEHVLPLLRERGFTATVFVATDHVGATSAWDAHVGTPTRIMDWDALAELAAAGMTVASHAASHRPLTALSHHDVVLEALRSRAALEERLGRQVTAIAYPYGDEDAVVRHLVGAAGLQMGLTCEHRRSHLRDEPLALPRIEIEGTDRLEDLVRKLG